MLGADYSTLFDALEEHVDSVMKMLIILVASHHTDLALFWKATKSGKGHDHLPTLLSSIKGVEGSRWLKATAITEWEKNSESGKANILHGCRLTKFITDPHLNQARKVVDGQMYVLRYPLPRYLATPLPRYLTSLPRYPLANLLVAWQS